MMKVRSDVLASTLDRNLTKSAAVEEEEDDEENVWLELLEKMLDGLEDESRPSVELADRISSELMFRTMSAVTAVRSGPHDSSQRLSTAMLVDCAI
jgi:hypothetical protein